MSDACQVCGRRFVNYNEGHTPNSKECLRNQVNDAKIILAHKNETANTFMNQVKKLQTRLQESKGLLRCVPEGVCELPDDWYSCRDALLNPTNKDVM